jgi:hypothetical protein
MISAIAKGRSAPTRLLTRIRGEFLELPCLRLSLQQASRLFGVEKDECMGILQHLVDTRFLKKTNDGSYIRQACAG